MPTPSYCGTTEAVGVGNGTDAVELALRAAGIGPGDEVVLPANTFVATAEAVARAGAEIVLADVTDDDLLLDPASVAERLTARTRAVVGVHLYGQLAPIERLRELVGEQVLLVEDAAQSQGARRLGRRSGSVGDIAATSFYPGKNLGAYGDAGAVTTSSPELAERLRALRNHGGVRRYEHEVLGVNSRLDSLQAVVLSAKLARLDAWNDERRAAADRYAELLGDVGRPAAADRDRGQRARLAPLRRALRAPRRGAGRPDGSRHRDRRALPGADPRAGALPSTSAGRETSRSRRRRRTRSCRCRCSRGSPTTSRPGWPA